MVEPDLEVVEERLVPEALVGRVIELLRSFGLAVWVYRGADWLVDDPDGPHVAREASTVQFQPTVVDGFEHVTTDIAKIVGVSDDHDAVDGRGGRRPRRSSASTSPSRARSSTTWT